MGNYSTAAVLGRVTCFQGSKRGSDLGFGEVREGFLEEGVAQLNSVER